MNNIIIKGRICKDLEIKITPKGTECLKFPVAVNRKYDREITDFFDCVAWGKTAEFIATYFDKGQEILIRGEMRQEKWQDKEGNNRVSWNLNVADVEFCGGKSGGARKDGPSFDELPDDELPF